jgi:hypothetical protein
LSDSAEGTSLRVQGKPFEYQVRLVFDGNIPAGAGETLSEKYLNIFTFQKTDHDH